MGSSPMLSAKLKRPVTAIATGFFVEISKGYGLFRLVLSCVFLLRLFQSCMPEYAQKYAQELELLNCEPVFSYV